MDAPARTTGGGVTVAAPVDRPRRGRAGAPGRGVSGAAASGVARACTNSAWTRAVSMPSPQGTGWMRYKSERQRAWEGRSGGPGPAARPRARQRCRRSRGGRPRARRPRRAAPARRCPPGRGPVPCRPPSAPSSAAAAARATRASRGIPATCRPGPRSSARRACPIHWSRARPPPGPPRSTCATRASATALGRRTRASRTWRGGWRRARARNFATAGWSFPSAPRASSAPGARSAPAPATPRSARAARAARASRNKPARARRRSRSAGRRARARRPRARRRRAAASQRWSSAADTRTTPARGCSPSW